VQTLSAQFQNTDKQQLTGESKDAPLKSKEEISISQTLSDELIKHYDKLLDHLSFSHFVELMKIGDEAKRFFYEIESTKGIWSVLGSESGLELALINDLKNFILELGHGFCFETQRR